MKKYDVQAATERLKWRVESLQRMVNLQMPWIVVGERAWTVFVLLQRILRAKRGKSSAGFRFWATLWVRRWQIGPGMRIWSWLWCTWHRKVLWKNDQQMAKVFFPESPVDAQEFADLSREFREGKKGCNLHRAMCI